MKHTYALQVASTGETIRQEESVKSMVVWWRRTEKKVLKDRRISAKFTDAILTGDVAVGWATYDEMKRGGWTPEMIRQETKRVMKGLDLEIEKRVASKGAENGSVVT